VSHPDDPALAQIDALQVRYIAALDARNMDGWLATFSSSAEASYICTTAESVEANLPLALILDDNHARLEDRVKFVTRIWVGTFADYRTRHFIQRTACRAVSAGVFDVETNFLVISTPSDTGRAQLFATGVYQDRVEMRSEGAVFISKKAVTDTAVVERFMVYPL
jgi:3-phenylpropionate/cinnamic acid dioxygenase small subunit